MNALNQTLAVLRSAVEDGLAKALEEAKGTNDHIAGLTDFHQAVAHAILGGGKRVRPCLTLLCAQACGMKDPAHDPDALRAALAIELLHCYTLVHDDLPAMDNDTERRGRPSVWAKFGEANAILVGDYIQALAFKTLPTVPEKPLAAILAQAPQMLFSARWQISPPRLIPRSAMPTIFSTLTRTRLGRSSGLPVVWGPAWQERTRKPSRLLPPMA